MWSNLIRTSDVFIYSKWGLGFMTKTRMMALIAVLAFIGIVASALAMPTMITGVSAQGNLTGNMSGGMMGNYSDKGGNMTAESGNISGLANVP